MLIQHSLSSSIMQSKAEGEETLGSAKDVALGFHDLLYSLSPQPDEQSVHDRPAIHMPCRLHNLLHGLITYKSAMQ